MPLCTICRTCRRGSTQRGGVGDFVLYLVLMFLYGVPMTLIQTAVTTMIQENAVGSMQGRVFGLLGTIYAGCLPMGMTLFDPVADILPLKDIMICSAVILILIAATLHCDRQFREIKECAIFLLQRMLKVLTISEAEKPKIQQRPAGKSSDWAFSVKTGADRANESKKEP